MSVKRWNGASWDTYAGSDVAAIKVTDGRVGKTTYVGAVTPTNPVDGDIWIDQDTATNAVVPTAFTSKGQILTGIGSAAYSVQPVGTDGYSLVADSTQSTGLNWISNSYAGKNAIINGGFDIWQRGTTSSAMTTATYAYQADRWYMYLSGASGSYYSSQQPTNDTTNLPFIRYCARIQKTSGNSGNTGCYWVYDLDYDSFARFAGQTTTISFYARIGSNFSGGSTNNLNLATYTGTTTDNHQYGGWAGQTNISNTNFTMTSNWQRFNVTIVPLATAKQISLQFAVTTSGIAGANDYWEITGVQMELGSIPTTFSKSGGTYQGELSACMRYYWRANAFGETYYPILGFGAGNSSTQARTIVPFPVQMRIKPTVIDYSTISNFAIFTMADAQVAPTAVAIDTNLTTSYSGWLSWTTAGGLTANTPYYVRGNNTTSAYLGFSAEL